MSKLYPIKGSIQNYAWGGSQYIPDLLGIEAEEKQYAEYWLGAHAKGPSVLTTSDGEQSLDAYLNTNMAQKLGREIATKFNRLPFLFKVLDVQQMLSIQVHPTKSEAEKGFRKENEKGIPLTASHRNYKDDNHKPEIMVALSEFWLLHGFLPKDQLRRRLQEVPEFSGLMPIFESEGYLGLYKKVMEQTAEERKEMLQPLIERILPLFLAGQLSKSNPDFWAANAFDPNTTPVNYDRGIYSIYFFNLVKVNRGEAIFQDAGIPHAYLEGQNMELMANSDNVLRGGLTPKHIDVPELLKHIKFEETRPNILTGELQADGIERIYKSPAPDFELSQIKIQNSNTYKSKTQTAEILILIGGEAEISNEEATMTLGRGEAVFLTAESTYQISTPSSTILYKATAPIS